MNGGRPVVLHVVRTPPQSDLYRVRPVLSHGTRPRPPGRARDAGSPEPAGDDGRRQRRLLQAPYRRELGDLPAGRRALVAARTSGAPASRSALDGRMVVDIFRLVGSWQAERRAARPLQKVNRRIETPPGIALFTPRLGQHDPEVARRRRGRAGRASRRRRSAFRSPARSRPSRAAAARRSRPAARCSRRAASARDALLAEAPVGSTVTVRLRLADFPDGAPDAIGGGPVLVRDGVPVRRPTSSSAFDQIARRHPRTAVGQLADGGFLFVVADGRSSSSYGLTQWALARAMADLGAVTAIGLDGGGSSTIAFDGHGPQHALRRPPAAGGERAVPLLLRGLCARRSASPSSRRTGTASTTRRPSRPRSCARSDARACGFVRPDGSVAWSREEVVAARVARPRRRRAGRCRKASGAGSRRRPRSAAGRSSRMERTFRVNRTLGHLRLSRRVLRVRPAAGGRLGVSVQLTRRRGSIVAVLGGDGRVRADALPRCSSSRARRAGAGTGAPSAGGSSARAPTPCACRRATLSGRSRCAPAVQVLRTPSS